MDNKTSVSKKDMHVGHEEKKKLPALVKYVVIAVIVIAAITVGIFVYFNAQNYVATIDGEKIKTDEFKYYLEAQKETMLSNAQAVDSTITADTFWATPINGESAIEVAKKMALNQVKETKVQLAKAKAAKVSLTKDEISSIDSSLQTNIIDQMDPQYNGTAGTGNKTRANTAFVKQYGFSIDVFRNVQIDYYTVQKYVSAEMDKITDADANVDNYYAKHPELYKEDTSYRKNGEEAVWARHILITVASSATNEQKDAAKKKAEEVITKLKNGEDFAKLASEYSEDPGSKDSGGDYLFGKGYMDSTFEAAAFALTAGKFTETPVLSSFGYHVILLEEKVAKDQPVSLKCAKEYDEYGTSFVKYQLYLEKETAWVKAAKVTENKSVYSSLS